MGNGRWLVACVFLALACAGKSTSRAGSSGAKADAGGDPPTPRDCKTSFACASGERCDKSVCVPEDGCPDAREPELLFDAPEGSPWTIGFNPHLTMLNGRETLIVSEQDEPGQVGERTYLRDLQTGRELVFVHAPGYASCSGDPARCEFPFRDMRAMAEIELGTDSVSIREETLFALSGYDWIQSPSDADYRERRILVAVGSVVELLELGSSEPIASVDLVEMSPLIVLVDDEGRSERIVSWQQASSITSENAKVSVTALETGATPRLIYTGLGGRNSALIPLQDGDDWYLLRDGDFGEPAVTVYRSDDALSVVGTLDVDWALGVDFEYRTGERALEPGPSAYVRNCNENECGSYLLRLDTVSLEEVATAELPEPGSHAIMSRALACGGADLIVANSFPDAPRRYWSLRIPGRAGFP